VGDVVIRALSVLVLLAVILTGAGAHGWAGYHFREAERLVQRQEFAAAHAHYARCLEVWRHSPASELRAARAARRAGLYPEAEQHLARCRQLQGEDPGTGVPLALETLLLQAQSGDVGEVEEVLWEYVKKEKPETPLILEALARGYVRMFRLGTALRCLQMLLERQPDNVEALVMRAKIREGGGEPEDSVGDFRRALDLAPEREDARLGLARVLLHDNPGEARGHYEHLLARRPDNLEALEGLAEVCAALGETDRVRALYEAALAGEPENSRALAGLAGLTLAAGNTAEGEALLRRAIAADPGNKEARYQLYLCLVQQPGREAEAAAEREAHNRVEADRLRLAQIGGKEMTRRPNDPALHFEMGSIYLRNGKPEVGLRWLYSALKLDPAHQPSHRALYEYYRRTGQEDRARQHRREIRPGPAKAPLDKP
jgi:tetratricopeptide (TPR) repeat protein